MKETIHCQKLNKIGNKLSSPPYATDLGRQIQQTICEEAWQQWQQYQTMLINEYRLNLLDKTSHEFLEAEMKKFLLKIPAQ